MINSIDPDPFTKGGAYIAGTRYKLGDYTPYLYKTEDYGKTWKLITNGIDPMHFTRVIRADPKRKGLLYAGTETAMYVSFDDGANWQTFQLNLPQVPITDLAIKNDNLIAATQGRSFWMIDDLTPLHQLSDAMANSDQYLYKPMDSYRMSGSQRDNNITEGRNHPGGVMVHFYLKEKPADSVDVQLTFLSADGSEIKTFSTKTKEKAHQLKDLKAGGNRFIWNMRYPNAKSFDGMIMWSGSMNGPKAVPGDYKVKLSIGEWSQVQDFKILKDPRSESTLEDLQAQFDFLMDIRNQVTEAHEAIIDIRKIKEQLKSFSEKVKEEEQMKDVIAKGEAIDSVISKIENELYQTKNRSRQDPLKLPNQVDQQVGALEFAQWSWRFPPN